MWCRKGTCEFLYRFSTFLALSRSLQMRCRNLTYYLQGYSTMTRRPKHAISCDREIDVSFMDNFVHCSYIGGTLRCITNSLHSATAIYVMLVHIAILINAALYLEFIVCASWASKFSDQQLPIARYGHVKRKIAQKSWIGCRVIRPRIWGSSGSYHLHENGSYHIHHLYHSKVVWMATDMQYVGQKLVDSHHFHWFYTFQPKPSIDPSVTYIHIVQATDYLGELFCPHSYYFE